MNIRDNGPVGHKNGVQHSNSFGSERLPKKMFFHSESGQADSGVLPKVVFCKYETPDFFQKNSDLSGDGNHDQKESAELREPGDREIQTDYLGKKYKNLKDMIEIISGNFRSGVQNLAPTNGVGYGQIVDKPANCLKGKKARVSFFLEDDQFMLSPSSNPQTIYVGKGKYKVDSPAYAFAGVVGDTANMLANTANFLGKAYAFQQILTPANVAFLSSSETASVAFFGQNLSVRSTSVDECHIYNAQNQSVFVVFRVRTNGLAAIECRQGGQLSPIEKRFVTATGLYVIETNKLHSLVIHDFNNPHYYGEVSLKVLHVEQGKSFFHYLQSDLDKKKRDVAARADVVESSLLSDSPFLNFENRSGIHLFFGENYQYQKNAIGRPVFYDTNDSSLKKIKFEDDSFCLYRISLPHDESFYYFQKPIINNPDNEEEHENNEEKDGGAEDIDFSRDAIQNCKKINGGDEKTELYFDTQRVQVVFSESQKGDPMLVKIGNFARIYVEYNRFAITRRNIISQCLDRNTDYRTNRDTHLRIFDTGAFLIDERHERLMGIFPSNTFTESFVVQENTEDGYPLELSGSLDYYILNAYKAVVPYFNGDYKQGYEIDQILRNCKLSEFIQSAIRQVLSSYVKQSSLDRIYGALLPPVPGAGNVAQNSRAQGEGASTQLQASIAEKCGNRGLEISNFNFNVTLNDNTLRQVAVNQICYYLQAQAEKDYLNDLNAFNNEARATMLTRVCSSFVDVLNDRGLNVVGNNIDAIVGASERVVSEINNGRLGLTFGTSSNLFQKGDSSLSEKEEKKLPSFRG